MSRAERDAVTTHLERQVRRWHVDLFPEEYDHVYDSTSESRERRKGVNPMAEDYVARTDARREALGFGPLPAGGEGPFADTWAWVERMLGEGREAELAAVLGAREEEDRLRARDAEDRRPAGRDLDREVDRRLAGEQFPTRVRAEETAEEALAFRIMGALFSIQPPYVDAETSEAAFFEQARRLLPECDEERRRALHRHALDRWTEIYGY